MDSSNSWFDNISGAISDAASNASTSVVTSAGDWLSSQASSLLDPSPAINSNPTPAQIAAGQTGQAQQAILKPSGAPQWMKGKDGKINLLIPALAVVGIIYFMKRGK